MAKPAPIDSAVNVTTRHNESAPSASEAATASISPEEATGALRPPKPAAACELVMGRIPGRQNHPRIAKTLAIIAGKIAATSAPDSPQALSLVDDYAQAVTAARPRYSRHP